MNAQERVRLQKLKDMTNILKDTDKNLTVCEEMIATYTQKKEQEKREEIQRKIDLEKKIIEILDNLKARLLVEYNDT